MFFWLSRIQDSNIHKLISLFSQLEFEYYRQEPQAPVLFDPTQFEDRYRREGATLEYRYHL